MNSSQYCARSGINSLFLTLERISPMKLLIIHFFSLDQQAVWFVPRVHGGPGGPAALRLQPPEAQPLRRGEQLPQQDAHVRVPHAGKHSYSREGQGWKKLSFLKKNLAQWFFLVFLGFLGLFAQTRGF